MLIFGLTGASLMLRGCNFPGPIRYGHYLAGFIRASFTCGVADLSLMKRPLLRTLRTFSPKHHAFDSTGLGVELWADCCHPICPWTGLLGWRLYPETDYAIQRYL